jgi:hypothetical protein
MGREGLIMPLLPSSTNAQYRGAPISAWFLLLSGVLEFVPGCIHYFIPERAITDIAGLNVGHNLSLIVSTFTWMGSMQIPFGLALMVVALRYRTLVPLFLLFNLTERALMSFAGWIWRVPADGHHPPEHYASPVSVVLLTIFLILSLRERTEA